MKIIATRVQMKDTKPGDILSIHDQEYWDAYCAGDKTKEGDLGTTVMLRSPEPVSDKVNGELVKDEYISRLTIE